MLVTADRGKVHPREKTSDWTWPLIVLLILAVSILSAGRSSASQAYYAGFALSGSATDLVHVFPYTSELVAEKTGKNTSVIDDVLNTQIANSTDLPIKPTAALADLRSGDAVTLALALNWENVSIERSENIAKIVVDVHADILIFDFDTKKIIGSFPLAIQVRDSIQVGGNIHTRVRSIFRELYLGNDADSLSGRFIERLRSVTIKRSYGNRVRVTDVTFDQPALDMLHGTNNSAEAFAGLVARGFARGLTDHLSIAVLPYMKDNVIGGVLPVKFADMAAFNLEIPPPDYLVHLTVRGFKKVLLDSNTVESAWAYGSYMRISVEQPISAKDGKPQFYVDSQVKFGATKKIPMTVAAPDDWSAYQESILSLLDQYGRQIAKPEKEWLKKWADQELTTEKLKALYGVLQSCR